MTKEQSKTGRKENSVVRFLKDIHGSIGRFSPLVSWLLLSTTIWAQSTNEGLEFFKRFVNGQEPVKEAVVYRRISKPDGKIINQDWVRFGFQRGSWYAQRLAPDTNDTANLIPLQGNSICGSSFTHLWVISDETVHVADKAFSAGSTPEQFGSLSRSLMERSLTFGIPIPSEGIGHIHWNDLNFTTSITNKDATSAAAKTNIVKGRLILGGDGLPNTAERERSASLPGAKMGYEYGTSVRGVPKVFTMTTDGPGGSIYRYEYLTLNIGKVDVEKTGGYVPQMFGNASLRRIGTIWTNDLPYTVLGNETIPAFETKQPKQTGSIILGAVIVVVSAFLALAYRRMKIKR